MDYTEVLQRMRKCGYTQRKLASAIGITEEQFCKKLAGQYDFKQSEILRICAVLDISRENIGRYFFTEKG